MLTVNEVNSFYGEVQALHSVSFAIDEGQIVSVIGANGAGKTTLLNTIMGVVKTRSGSVEFKGERLTGLKTHDIVKRRVTCVPEGRKIFPKLTVRENLEMGAFSRKIKKSELQRDIEEVYDIFPRLRERNSQNGGTLSGGEQQMLAIGRGLMNKPELLLLDEPSLGLAPIIVDDMFQIIRQINERLGISIILVEQNAYMAMEVSNETYVLENGVMVMHGASSELIHDPAVTKAYLGGGG
ncbi:ABC transporter ATP-binding protein [Clostridiales bacterium BX7]|uniref:ABC transporter ATP-binding protein n=1 Tax=Feifania hominis TaxID=2763660 RepID=A0A926DEG9_9FIRM|nr:ABC transporter ATP-binding protein [Feifania hominis]